MQIQPTAEQSLWDFIFEVTPSNCPFNAQQKFMECYLGHLFVSSYRLLKKDHENRCAIMHRKWNAKTQYLFLMVIESFNTINDYQVFRSVRKSIDKVIKFRKCAQMDYVVIYCLLTPKKVVQFHKELFQKVDISKPSNLQQTLSKATCIDCINPPKPEEDMVLISKDQCNKLKEVIYNYVDTFSARHRTNIYSELQKRATNGYQINTILNTISRIIYIETLGQPYNQIESSNWTCFEIRAKQKLNSDRKDIVLTGQAKILMLNIIFLQTLEEYLKESEREAKEVLMESRNVYKDGAIKVYKITDTLDSSGVVYQFESAVLKTFETLI